MRTRKYDSSGCGKVFMMVVLMTACFSLNSCKCPPLPPPEPTRVVLEIKASGDINPNDEGRPSPVVVRIYQLLSAEKFEHADFYSLFENDKETLKYDFLGSEEILVVPNEKRTMFFEPHQDTVCIGVLASFRHFEKGEFRSAIAVKPNKFARLFLNIRDTKIDIK
jgi:type VI secretion system protein VasD